MIMKPEIGMTVIYQRVFMLEGREAVITDVVSKTIIRIRIEDDEILESIPENLFERKA